MNDLLLCRIPALSICYATPRHRFLSCARSVISARSFMSVVWLSVESVKIYVENY